ncbi:MAG: hypothetical protein ACI85O_003851 [Saprospiraceae bacterium]|jgi:hypothetical protein
MRIFHVIFISTLLISLFSCENAPQSATEATVEKPTLRAAPNELVVSLEKAHHTAEVLSNDVISFDLKLTLGGRVAFNGTVTSRTDSGKIKLKRKSDNTEVIFNGEKTFISSNTAEWKGARSSIFTWQYFFMAPFKLNDSGTKWDLTGEKLIGGQAHNTGKLSFEAGTGDAPDDWYLIYQNPKDSIMSGMAYIVTGGGTTQEEAEKNAHAIYYRDYQELRSGVPISSNWDFYNWNEEEGFNGNPIGTAAISNVRLIKDEGEIFNIPIGAKELEE